jgi:hypothetical protein
MALVRTVIIHLSFSFLLILLYHIAIRSDRSYLPLLCVSTVIFLDLLTLVRRKLHTDLQPDHEGVVGPYMRVGIPRMGVCVALHRGLLQPLR